MCLLGKQCIPFSNILFIASAPLDGYQNATDQVQRSIFLAISVMITFPHSHLAAEYPEYQDRVTDDQRQQDDGADQHENLR